MKEEYYKKRGAQYGVGHTRLKHILELAGNVEGKNILDVGCSRGYIGRRLKALGGNVTGIDISPEAAEEAKKFLDRVLVFDIEKPWPAEAKADKYNLTIISEILEHVFDPSEVLGTLNDIIKEGGEVILTVPNFLVWTNRLKILFGGFRYSQQGILDFGHIRFFSYDYLKEVLKNNNFEIIRKKHIIFPGKLAFILKYFPSVFAVQFVVKARKRP